MAYTPLPHRVRFGRFELDAANVDLRKDGRRVRLRPQALTLLALLVDRAGQLVTREELRATLWADDTFVDFDHSLNVTIGEVRRALVDSASAAWAIETVPRRGYRFIAPVEVVDPQALRRRASDRVAPVPAPAASAMADPAVPAAFVGAPEAAPAATVAAAEGTLPETSGPPPDRVRGWRSSWAGWMLLAASMTVALAMALPSGTAVPTAPAVPSAGARPGGTTNVQAWQAYARARVHWSRRNDCTRAIDDYRAATAADPDFALAWVGIADCYTIRGDREEAQHAIAEATRRNPNLGEMHASRGLWRMFLAWDWRGARESLETAMRLAPEYASAHQWAGMLAIFQGRAAEARALLARAAALDPTSPTIAADQAWAELLAGQPTAALAHCQHARRLAPDHEFTVSCFVAAYRRLGHPREEHAALYAEMPATDAEARRLLAAMHRSEVERLRGQKPLVDFVLARHLAVLGNHDQALEHLKAAVNDREFLVPFAVVEPSFDPLRQSPAFRTLMEKAGLPTEVAP